MSMKLAFLLPALFLAFPHGHAGAAPFEPSVLEALQPPAEHGAFHSGWISLGLKAAALKEKQVSPGHITNVGEAQMQLYFPAGWKPQDRRAALCIFPGGGYAIQAIEKEGGHIARWAAEHGMVGVVVKYRVSGSNDAVGRFPGPLLDARQALRVTRRHASALGVDPHRIGVMGFSAGGHLAAMASTLWNRPLPEEAENPLKSVSARPDFSLLIYPVITMDPKTTHGGTRSRILGPAPGADLAELCSAERQVTPQTPPVFLVHALDDGVASANSRLMEQACREKGIPSSLHFYPSGGHGYGMEKRGQPTDKWPEAAEQWLAERGILPSPAPACGNAPSGAGAPRNTAGMNALGPDLCRTAGLTGNGPGATFFGHECARKEL